MRVAIYARKSNDQAGVADDQKSVARQIDHARQYAERKGWTVSHDHIFTDDGISGAEFAGRPGFVRLMNALKPRPAFDILVMSEESRLGREAIETAYALKQLVTTGVRVFFYLEDRERTLDSPTDKIMLSLTAFADELERERARQRTYDAMLRKAKAGHVTGGRVFGYRNVDVLTVAGERSHVELQIEEAEAAVVREIFDRAGIGDGFRAIARRLNAAGAVSPRAQRGRPSGWAPSSVREILHRELYRGRQIWNKTRKRNAWGQHQQRDRPSPEWIVREREDLRIVTEAQWQRVRDREAARQPPASPAIVRRPDGRGVHAKYLLAGFARCDQCGGAMQVVSRSSTRARTRRYGCATYWNRGASVCANRRQADMLAADRTVHELLTQDVLTPAIVDNAVALVMARIQRDSDSPTRERLAADLDQIERELANLSDAVSKGAAIPEILHAITVRDAERRRLVATLRSMNDRRTLSFTCITPAKVRGLLSEWQAMLAADVQQAREILKLVLADRIGFQPLGETYELRIPITMDRLLTAVLPGELQELVASPPGLGQVLYRRQLAA